MPLSIRGSALEKPSADDQAALDNQPGRGSSTQEIAPDQGLLAATFVRQTLPTTEYSRRNNHPGTAPDPDIRPTIATRSRIVPEEWNVLARLQDGGPFSKAPQTYDASRALLSPSDFGSPHIRLPSRRCGFDRERSIGLAEHFRHLSSCTVDSGHDVIDLIFNDIIDLTVDTGLVDRRQLALTSTRLSGVDTQARSF
ncbi:hypothetical protein FCOIX_8773 [Fusarium coicis]|nr:hypothetical protein FCOIX_8773 [Fusarium coicis]